MAQTDKNVIEESQMFLVPASILFAAIGIAETEPLKALLSAMGVAISIIWLCRGFAWTQTLDKFTAIGFAFTFLTGGAISMVVHVSRWLAPA